MNEAKPEGDEVEAEQPFWERRRGVEGEAGPSVGGGAQKGAKSFPEPGSGTTDGGRWIQRRRWKGGNHIYYVRHVTQHFGRSTTIRSRRTYLLEIGAKFALIQKAKRGITDD